MTEAPIIAVGDCVYLRSGSPKMTVIRLDGEDNALCLWFPHGEAKTEQIFIPLVALQRADAYTPKSTGERHER